MAVLFYYRKRWPNQSKEGVSQFRKGVCLPRRRFLSRKLCNKQPSSIPLCVSYFAPNSFDIFPVFLHSFFSLLSLISRLFRRSPLFGLFLFRYGNFPPLFLIFYFVYFCFWLFIIHIYLRLLCPFCVDFILFFDFRWLMVWVFYFYGFFF